MIAVLPVIVGIDFWNDITNPFLQSIRKYHPTAPVVVIDNNSKSVYPPTTPETYLMRTTDRLGYNQAMNYAAEHGPKAEKYVFFNNDCLCHGYFIDIVAGLDEDTLYGSGINHDDLTGRDWQWSAWLVISRKIWEAVGEFDPELSAGFEDFDYQLRAEAAGFKLAEAHLPIEHLDKHTRFRERHYQQRWNMSRLHFQDKHNYPTEPWIPK